MTTTGYLRLQSIIIRERVGEVSGIMSLRVMDLLRKRSPGLVLLETFMLLDQCIWNLGQPKYKCC